MIQFDGIELDPVAMGSQGNAILGIRDSGKTYTAMALAEVMMDAGIPIFAFDPIGVWRFLRVPGAGKGYPVVVAGGKEGDLPLTPECGVAIPHRAEAEYAAALHWMIGHALKAGPEWRSSAISELRAMKAAQEAK